MCTILGALVGAQTILGVAGSNAAAQGQAAVANQQAAVNDRNAQIVRTDAANQAAVSRDDNRSILAQQEGQFAAMGVDVSSGSPLAVLARNRERLEYNTQLGIYEAEKTAIGAEDAAAANRASAQGFRQAGRIGAATALVGGATQANSFHQQGLLLPSTSTTPSTTQPRDITNQRARLGG